MRAELRGNGEKKDGKGERMEERVFSVSAPFFEEELYVDKPAKKPAVNSLLLLVLGLMATIFCISGATDISAFGGGTREHGHLTGLQQLMGDYSTQSSYLAREEIIRYEKNLQRFFIHYDGFVPETANSVGAASEEEIKRLQMEHEIIYQQAAREIMDRYNPQIRDIEEVLNQKRLENNGYIENYQGDAWFIMSETDGTDGIADISSVEPMASEEYNEYARLIRERDDLIAGITEKYLLTDEQAAKIIEQNKQETNVYDISNYYEIKSYLEDTRFLRYCLKSSRSEGYITNIPEALWAGYENPLQFVESQADYFISVQDDYFSIDFNGRPLNEWFKNAGITGYVFAPEPYAGVNPIAAYLNEKINVRTIYRNFSIITILGSFAAIFIWVLFIKSDKAAVRKAEKTAKKIYMGMPLSVKAALFFAAGITIIITVQQFQGFCYRIYNSGLGAALQSIPFLAAAAAGVLYVLLCLMHLWEFARKPSILLNEPEIRLIIRLFKNVGTVYGQQVTSLSLSMTFLVFVYVLIQLALISVLVSIGWSIEPLLYLLCEIIINILALYVFGLITALAKTNKYMDAIISGDFDAEITEKGGYKAVINKLNRVRGGVRRVVVEKNKSDKMKADLITNVSHDLKTPLTSIINYIELLKSAQITEAERAEYLDVLDRKAQRVKLLIDDLFEATKLSSGQITLEKSDINIVDLLKQAVGELEEKFVSAGITLKLTYTDENIPIAADGKKLWRVFENLFTNILKYSQPGTRAYVDVCRKGSLAGLAFKNISFYEMNFEYDEIFERGKRGDASRSTEGSGLGLSIARDIIELHGGTMGVSIDGDLFKVEVTLPV